jgi:hypothetical protein
MKCYLLAIAFLLSVPHGGHAQSQTGRNFGVPYSGTAASRSNSGSSSNGHTRRSNSDSDADNQSSSRDSSGGGHEIDARDTEGSAPTARQASTPR